MTNPEVGLTIDAAGFATNYHDYAPDAGAGVDADPVLLLHGSGPGVSAWANWRLALPVLGAQVRCVAPDIVGFGFTERPAEAAYTMDLWVPHVLGFLDALGLERVQVVGNSFGGALALQLALRAPDRVSRLVLMGAVGTSFPITDGLERTWGFEPSVEAMEELIGIFAYDASLVSRDLAEMRLAAATRPGVQEAFAAMFPAPRQAAVDALAIPDEQLAGIGQETLIVHGREDRVIPLESSLRLFAHIPRAQLHVFGECGHWTQIEHADRFHSLVGTFLTS